MYKKALFCSKYINLDQPKPMQTLNFIVLDYDPFGMIISGRNWAAGSSYRYGFNGKEQDQETYGNGNIYDYGFRIYNPRLGKFLSVDPLTKNYVMLTPYQFCSNRPIDGIDLDGLEYLDDDEARFNFRTGEIHLNTENNGGVISKRWKDYLYAVPTSILMCDGSPNCVDYVSPTLMGTFQFKSYKIEIGEMDNGYVNQNPTMEDSPTMPKAIGQGEKLAEHYYKEPQNGNSKKVGKNPAPIKMNSGSTEYNVSRGIYTANKYIAIVEGAVWLAGPIGNHFAKKNLRKAETQAQIYSTMVINDITIAFNSNVIDPKLVSNGEYISDISNWLLYGETKVGSSSIYGMSDSDYAAKVISDAQRIFITISMRNIIKPEAKRPKGD